MSKKWTKDEIDIVKANYSDMSMDELIKLLPGRTAAGIKRVANFFLVYKESSKSHIDDRGWFIPPSRRH